MVNRPPPERVFRVRILVPPHAKYQNTLVRSDEGVLFNCYSVVGGVPQVHGSFPHVGQVAIFMSRYDLWLIADLYLILRADMIVPC